VHVMLLDDLVVYTIEGDAVGDWAARVIFCAVGVRRVVVASCRLVAGQDHEAFGERYC
jgi:hypothetical protein